MSKQLPAEIGVSVRAHLREFFQNDRTTSLTDLCDQVEIQLQLLAENTLLGSIQYLAAQKRLRFLTTESGYFFYDKSVYEIRITEHPTNASVLQVALVCQSPDKARPMRKAHKVTFESPGRYNELSIITDKAFLPYQRDLSEAITAVYVSGYRWLSEYIRSALDLIHKEAAENLYSHLREILPTHLADNIWLYAIIDQNGIYIPSALNRQIALDRAMKRRIRTDESPIQLVADFSTRLLDFDKLFSKIAVRNDAVVEGEFLKAPYAGSRIEIAEEAIYEHKGLSTQPLVREGKTLLVAGYPSPIRSQVESILKRERKKIKEILDGKASSLRTMIQEVRKSGTLPGASAKYTWLAGWFMRGYSGIE